jgi:hypothetical protein
MITLALALYLDILGTIWGVTAHSFDVGPGGTTYVWVTVDADPRRVLHVPLTSLKT